MASVTELNIRRRSAILLVAAVLALLAGTAVLWSWARRIWNVHSSAAEWPAYEGFPWSMRTLAPETRPATASRSAVGACASGRVAATWSESSP
jgi:hypothetical protein